MLLLNNVDALNKASYFKKKLDYERLSIIVIIET